MTCSWWFEKFFFRKKSAKKFISKMINKHGSGFYYEKKKHIIGCTVMFTTTEIVTESFTSALCGNDFTVTQAGEIVKV